MLVIIFMMHLTILKLHRKCTDSNPRRPKSSSKSSCHMRFDLFFYGVSPFQFEGNEAMEDERENALEDLQPEEDPKRESADNKHKINSPILPTHGAIMI